MKLNLSRPLVFFDLETTGLNVGKDHIVEISLIKVMPDGSEIERTQRIRPVNLVQGPDGNVQEIEVHIPEECSAIHGIYDEDVYDKPSFPELADELLAFIGDADLAGYNSNKFDVPLLLEEFLRCGKELNMLNRQLIDVQNIFHKMEPRNLIAAYKFYCNKDLNNAHSANADTRATYEVFKAQLERYADTEYTDPRTRKVFKPIQNDVKALSAFTRENRIVDMAGHIVWNAQDQAVFNFGKHKNVPVKEVFIKEPAYYDWMMKADFPLYTKAKITELYNDVRLERKFNRTLFD
jgi:DNA polymerase-3 subunit epsilon